MHEKPSKSRHLYKSLGMESWDIFTIASIRMTGPCLLDSAISASKRHGGGCKHSPECGVGPIFASLRVESGSGASGPTGGTRSPADALGFAQLIPRGSVVYWQLRRRSSASRSGLPPGYSLELADRSVDRELATLLSRKPWIWRSFLFRADNIGWWHRLVLNCAIRLV